MSTKLHFENGDVQVQEVVFDDHGKINAFATKMFLRRWPSRLLRIEADVICSYLATLTDDGEVVLTLGGQVVDGVQDVASPSTVVPRKETVHVVEPAAAPIPPPSSDERASSFESLAGMRPRLADALQQRPGEVLFEPLQQENARGVVVVGLLKTPMMMSYSPADDARSNITIPRGEILQNVGYMEQQVPVSDMAKDGRMKMLMCRTQDGRMLLLPEFDMIAAPRGTKERRTVQGNPKAPDSVPLQFMEDRDGNIADNRTVEVQDKTTGATRQMMVGSIPDRIPLVHQ